MVILDMFATYVEVFGGGDVSFYMIFSQIQMFWYYISEYLFDCKYSLWRFRLIHLWRDCSSAMPVASFWHIVHRFVGCLNDVVFSKCCSLKQLFECFLLSIVWDFVCWFKKKKKKMFPKYLTPGKRFQINWC